MKPTINRVAFVEDREWQHFMLTSWLDRIDRTEYNKFEEYNLPNNYFDYMMECETEELRERIKLILQYDR